MDFFEHQDLARRKTRLLIVYFTLAVILTMVAVYAVCALALHETVASPTRVVIIDGGQAMAHATNPLWDQLPFDPELMFLVFCGTGLVIGLGSSVKTYQLSQGGRYVAQMLGGSRLRSNPTDLKEKQLLNVVEEISIASGCPVPEVFILKEESSINAFAAGYDLKDAVIGVTRGTMELLSRDELQGVIAHEFSHILNGDMKLNMRMTCLTHGILYIAETGRLLLQLPFRGMAWSASASSSGDSQKGGMPVQILLFIMAMGFALIIIGSIGFFFTKLIKSAVSRQREFLADAAAVQFTRNPGGIGGALKKIGGLRTGGRIRSTQAAEASHFFFANGLAASWFRAFSTHPPLIDRILRIDHTFDGTFPVIKEPPPLPLDDGSYRKKKRRVPGILDPGITQPPPIPLAMAGLMDQIGTPDAIHLEEARDLADSIPHVLHEAAHEPYGARAIAYGLLLDDEPEVRRHQMETLYKVMDSPVLVLLEELLPAMQELSPRHRLILLDLSLTALRELSTDQYLTFRHTIRHLIEADEAISLFEYAMEKRLERHLDPAFHEKPPRQPAIHSLLPVWDDCLHLLAALAYVGSENEKEARAAFEAGVRELNLAGQSTSFPSQEEACLARVDQALNRCAGLTPMHQRNLLYACSRVVLHNQRLDDEEAELLRAMADHLGCPLPPFINEQLAQF